MSRGIVTSFSTKTGYGFIDDSETGESIFVHQRDIDMDGYRHLKVGEEVKYNVEENDRGYKAVNVTLVSERVDDDRRRDYDDRPPRRNDRYDNRDRGYDNRDRGHRGGGHRHSGPSWDDFNRLKELVYTQKGIINRMIEAMGTETEDGGSLLTKDEIRQIRTGEPARETADT